MEESEMLQQLEGKANAGDVEAMYELGWRSALGMGLPQDDAVGVQWIQAAAEAGHTLAQNNLGARYLSGEGVEQSEIEAYVWFSRAAARGDRKAGKNRDTVAANLSPEDLIKAQERLK